MQVMGVVNVTDDSFSDGGRYLDPDRAVEHGLRLAAEGAAIIDVGGESTRPGAVRIEPQVETARVVPVVKQLAAQGLRSASTRSAPGWRARRSRAAPGSSTTSPVGAPTQRWRRC
ncbi:pterin binding enzyme family protein [Mycobacterium xenopi 3993]|nr:pterin binding enzyme family protein [Mycobacterium xenopi 3993]